MIGFEDIASLSLFIFYLDLEDFSNTSANIIYCLWLDKKHSFDIHFNIIHEYNNKYIHILFINIII